MGERPGTRNGQGVQKPPLRGQGRNDKGRGLIDKFNREGSPLDTRDKGRFSRENLDARDSELNLRENDSRNKSVRGYG
jgi:hypothetical protein